MRDWRLALFLVLAHCQLVSHVVAEEPAFVKSLPLELLDQQPIEHPTHHVQGLAVSSDSYWISSVDRQAKKGYIYRFDRTKGRVAAERELTFAAQFHPGGIDLADGALWVPVAEYRPRSTTTIVKLDPATLATQASFRVDDHIGCVAVDEKNGMLAANWDARVFYRFDLEGKRLEERANPRPARYQDLKHLGTRILAGGTEAVAGRPTTVIDMLDPVTFALLSRYEPRGSLRTGGNKFGREGCALFGDSLYLMPEDGPNTTIYRFAMPPR